MADENIVIGVDLKDDFTGPARRVVKSIDGIGDSAKSSRPELDALESGVEGVGDESVKTSVKARAASRRIREMGNESLKAAAKIRVLSSVISRLDRLNRSGGGPGVGGGAGAGGNGGTGKYIKAGFQFRGLRIAMIIAAIASVIPSVIAGISALGAAVMGLAGALGPLTGLIVAYPGYLAAFGQAFAAIKMSVSGLGEAIKTSLDPTATAQELRGLKTEFSSLGREFVGQFIRNISIAKRELDGMRGAIQQAFLPALNNLVSVGRNLFPTISAGLASTGAALGSVVNKFAEAINNTGFANQLTQIMGANVQIISNFGDAAISGFRALMDILVAAGPMLTKISSDIASMFQTLSGAVGANSASGGLTAFFEETYAVAKQVVQIFWDIGVALKNIAAIGAPLGKEILGSFSAIAEEFRSFTESGEGVKSIGQWFTEMRPVIYEMGYLIRDVAKAFMGLSRPDQAVLILQTLRTEALPVIESVIQSMGDLLPAFLSVGISVLKVVDAIMKMAPLEGFVTVIAFAFQGLADLLNAFASGPLSAIGTGIMTVVTAIVGMKIFGVIFALFSKMAIGLVSTITTLGGVLGGATGGAMTLGTALSALAGPIGWVIAGIVALVALLVTMWRSSEAFRNGVTNAFNMVRDAIVGAVDMIRGKLEENAASVNFLRNAFVAVVDFIGNYVVPIYGTYLAGVIKVVAFLIGMLIDYWGLLAKGMQSVAQVALSVGAIIVRGIGTAVEAIHTLILDMAANLVEAFGWLPGGIGDALRAGADKMREFSKGTVSAFNTVADGLESGAAAVGNWSMAAADGIEELSGSVDELARSTQAATSNLQKLNGWLDMLSSNASWRQSFMDLKTAMEEGTSFKRFTEEGEKNLASLRGAVDQSLEKVQKLYEGGNVKGAERVLQKRIGMLESIMLQLPKKDRKPFEKMIGELKTQRRRFDAQIAAMMNDPIKAEVPVELKIKADIRTPSTDDIPQSVLQGLPDISTTTTVERKINVDTTQVDAAKIKTDSLNTTLNTISGTTFNITVSYNSLSMAVVKAQTLKMELIALTSKPWIVNVEYKETGKRAEGGPVTSGRIYTVGERGPEAFIGKSGGISMIGVHGQQQKTFGEDGWVVPNHQLAAATAEMANDRPRSNRYEIGDTAPVINIGTINASNEIDVIKAVKKGIAEAERNRRERS